MNFVHYKEANITGMYHVSGKPYLSQLRLFYDQQEIRCRILMLLEIRANAAELSEHIHLQDILDE